MMIDAKRIPMMYPSPMTAAEVFMVNTALIRSVKCESTPIEAVEKTSAHPFIEGPTKSKIAATTAE